jgi:hypothetical protein
MAAAAVVNQRQRLGALVHRDRFRDRRSATAVIIAWPVPSAT